MIVRLGLALIATALFACGGHHGNGDDGGVGDDGNGGNGDGNFPMIDAPPFNGMCNPANPQCSNCIDDDHDGRIDGFDPECTGPFDNDEATFATGIPGDNKDAINQDCFFDGDSGAGNDGCNQHVCCLLGAHDKNECSADLVGLVNNAQQEGQKYDVTKCFPPLGSAVIPQQCVNVCGPLSPPGCDCFGCCTICDPVSNNCYDIAINSATSPNCTPDKLADPTMCKPCQKTTACGGGLCGGTTCILCPGQDPSDLPPSCNMAVCPAGITPCPTGNECGNEQYCSAGCCVGVIQ